MIRIIRITLFITVYLAISSSIAENIPPVTNIIAKDLNKIQWNIDSLLNKGKVLAVHQVYSH